MDPIIQIFWTSTSQDEARNVANELLKCRLAACIQISKEIESHYIWKGTSTRSTEILVTIKTKKSLFDAVKELIEVHSSYEEPEIIYTILDGGSKSYLKWVEQNVQH